MAINHYDIGDDVRVSITFTDEAGDPADPTTSVTLKFSDPSGNVTTWVSGVDAEVVKDSTGVYHADIPASSAGTWAYSWIGVGTTDAMDDGQFIVDVPLVA